MVLSFSIFIEFIWKNMTNLASKLDKSINR